MFCNCILSLPLFLCIYFYLLLLICQYLFMLSFSIQLLLSAFISSHLQVPTEIVILLLPFSSEKVRQGNCYFIKASHLKDNA